MNNEPVLAQEPSTAYKLKKFFQRHQLPSLLTALAVALAVVFVTTTIQQNAIIKKERDQAVREQQRAQAISDSFIQAFKNADPANTLGNQVTAGQILDETARLLDRNDIIDPILRSELAISIAQVYNNMGNYDQALKTLAVAEAHKTELSEIMLQAIIIQKSKALNDSGNFKEAFALFDSFGQTIYEFPRISIAFSEVLHSNGQLEKAKDVLSKAFEKLPFDHPQYVQVCTQLGRINTLSALHDEMLELFEECQNNNQSQNDFSNKWQQIQMLKIIARSHQIPSESNNSLEDSRKKAIEYYTQALNLQKEIFPENHISFVEIYKNLGWNSMLAKDYEKSLEYQNKAYQIYLSYFGENNPNTATAIFNSAHVYSRMEDYEKAIQTYNKAIDIMIDSEESNNHRLGFFYKALANTEIESELFSDAEKSALLCQEIFDNKGGTYTYRGSECEVLLTAAYNGQGKTELAKQQIIETLPDMYVMHKTGDEMQIMAEQLAEELGVDNPYKQELNEDSSE